jgi:uncharacterized protein with PQ loop repeat
MNSLLSKLLLLVNNNFTEIAMLTMNQTDPLTGNMTSHELLITNISKLSGILSLSVWLFAQLPQIIENHLNQSVSGVSLAFLLCWIGGDTTNLLGCLLTKALPFQTSLAAYYCFIDCILSLQYWYYTKVYPKQKVHHNMLQSPNMVATHSLSKKRSMVSLRRNRFDQDPTRSPMEITNSHINRKRQNQSSFFKKLVTGSFISSSLTKKVEAMPIRHVLADPDVIRTSDAIPLAPLPLVDQIHAKLHQFAVIFSSFTSHLDHDFSWNDIGKISAWSCSVLYLCSRLPQILKNYWAQSTKGISVYLFLFAMLGNVFYTISIVTDLYLLSLKSYSQETEPTGLKFHRVLMDQLPFIVGSSGTVFFDSIILLQCWIYKATRHSSTSGISNHELDNLPYSPKHGHKRKTKKSKSPTTFQKPDWYTNNHSAFTNDENIDYYFNPRERQTRRTPLVEPTERSSLMHYQSSIVNTPPHYISSSQQAGTHMSKSSTNFGIIHTINAIAKSISRSDSFLKSPNSVTSALSNTYSTSKLDGISASPLTTSLIPSIIGNYSSVSKKMSNDSKIPFSPIDFLNDDFHTHIEGSFGSQKKNLSSNYDNI